MNIPTGFGRWVRGAVWLPGFMRKDAEISAYRYLTALAVAGFLAGCQSAPQRVTVCPVIPASLLRDCGRCSDSPPKTNGELAEAWMDCRQCVAEYRIRMEAVGELAGCRAVQNSNSAP